MSKTTTFLRALGALGIALGGAWYLSVYSCTYPGGSTPGLPPGFVSLEADAPTAVGGLRLLRPTSYAIGSLEHAHEQYLEALPELAPQRLHFALPSVAQLELDTLVAKRERNDPPAANASGAPALRPWSPAGRIARDLVFFAWDGAAGFDAHVEVFEDEALPPLARFRVTSAGGWYPSDARGLEDGRTYRYRVVGREEQSALRAFRIETPEEARHYELARRGLQRVTNERYRAILEVLLARADERTSTAVELARRAHTLYPEEALVAPLEALLEAELGVASAGR